MQIRRTAISVTTRRIFSITTKRILVLVQDKMEVNENIQKVLENIKIDFQNTAGDTFQVDLKIFNFSS